MEWNGTPHLFVTIDQPNRTTLVLLLTWEASVSWTCYPMLSQMMAILGRRRCSTWFFISYFQTKPIWRSWRWVKRWISSMGRRTSMNITWGIRYGVAIYPHKGHPVGLLKWSRQKDPKVSERSRRQCENEVMAYGYLSIMVIIYHNMSQLSWEGL